MEINKEMVEYLYQRAKQYMIYKYGRTPDYIEICKDTTDSEAYIQAVELTYRCGDKNTDYYPISIEELNGDFSEFIKIRLEEEAKELSARKAREVVERVKRENRDKEDKEERKRKYFELKKEFEA